MKQKWMVKLILFSCHKRWVTVQLTKLYFTYTMMLKTHGIVLKTTLDYITKQTIPLPIVLFGELKKDEDRKSTRLNSSHVRISYAVFCLKKKKKNKRKQIITI